MEGGGLREGGERVAWKGVVGRWILGTRTSCPYQRWGCGVVGAGGWVGMERGGLIEDEEDGGGGV